MIHYNKQYPSLSLCATFKWLLWFAFKNPPNLIVNQFFGITMLVKPRTCLKICLKEIGMSFINGWRTSQKRVLNYSLLIYVYVNYSLLIYVYVSTYNLIINVLFHTKQLQCQGAPVFGFSSSIGFYLPLKKMGNNEIPFSIFFGIISSTSERNLVFTTPLI